MRGRDHALNDVNVVTCIKKAPVLVAFLLVRIESVFEDLLGEGSNLICALHCEERIEPHSSKSPIAQRRSQTFTIIVEDVDNALMFTGSLVYVADQFQVQLAA